MGLIFATLYEPLSWVGEVAGMRRARQRLLAHAHGRMLELGAGTGANFPYYPGGVAQVVATEPDRHMRARAVKKALAAARPLLVQDADAQRLPFPDAAFDTVVGTLVFCTIPDPARALQEAQRVLKPGGQLLLLEHVRGPDPVRGAIQDALTPLWKRLAGGCHPNRDTLAAVKKAGFSVDTVHRHAGPLTFLSIVARRP
ncbi:MAG: class I SAM-dependent methyltransferase [Chloroflexi bacterium]|nr:class I SAM-dependent methyltransferase [Chloroflexota bacterium]